MRFLKKVKGLNWERISEVHKIVMWRSLCYVEIVAGVFAFVWHAQSTVEKESMILTSLLAYLGGYALDFREEYKSPKSHGDLILDGHIARGRFLRYRNPIAIIYWTLRGVHWCLDQAFVVLPTKRQVKKRCAIIKAGAERYRSRKK
ncbi:MAG: hypothetical protein JWN50_132 [Parcubacteria group bacterium]|nr:hypothetical protein [Parcubacteria group bacterium]